MCTGRGEEYLLTRYALERLLFRIGQSSYVNEFILKGAMLFSLWEGNPHRATRDLDLLGFGPSEVERLEQVFRSLCALAVDDDGLVFHSETLRARATREDQEDGGVRVLLQATLGTARLRLQVDVGFGDAVTPAAQIITYPALLDLPPPQIRAYPRETVIAEKFEAMVRLGIGNTRMKDFHDLWVLGRRFAFSGLALASAINATFARRGTPIPESTPLALTSEFADDPGKGAEWKAYLSEICWILSAPHWL